MKFTEKQAKEDLKELISMYESLMIYIKWKKLEDDCNKNLNLDFGSQTIERIKKYID